MKRKPIPLEMVDTINAWLASGRTARVYPFNGTISLNGMAEVPYYTAFDKMRAVLEGART